MTVAKFRLRKEARETRRALAHPDIGAALAAHAGTLDIPQGAIVGGYHALPDEADPALLLVRLAEMGCHIAFPRVEAKDLPLAYHRVPDDFYAGGETLAPGFAGIHEPLEHWPRVIPHILLVPLLAFDDRGHRLGYGGGFYDRTLAALKVPAIGIAYAGQRLPAIPNEAHDLALGAILTEAGFTRYTE